MKTKAAANEARHLNFWRTALWVVIAAGAFHAAYLSTYTSVLILVYLFALVQLAQAGTWRKTYYSGLAVGLLIATGRLDFFWGIFSGGAMALWYVYAFWIGLFVALTGACLRAGRAASAPPGTPGRAHPHTAPGVRPSSGAASLEWVDALDGADAVLLAEAAAPGDGRTPVPSRSMGAVRGCARPGRAATQWMRRTLAWSGWLVIPFLWLGLEYFRSELYYLRFSWLSPGYGFPGAPWHWPLHAFGIYGTGFVLMSCACAAAFLWRRSALQGTGVLLLGAGSLALCGVAGGTSVFDKPTAISLGSPLRVTGIQMENPALDAVLFRLDESIRKHPDTELIVLSEYTFQDQVPNQINAWCRKNRRYLIIGGEDRAPGNNYYNTAFVIGPSGEIVFRQAKSVPIQFFKDGLPAPEQQLWNSPWGKIGICICYDLSYTRVTDRLVELGAQALIVPTMDVWDWGLRQHQLHARVAPVRAAEYGIPIFRLASSGISQWVNGAGRTLASAPCPGDGAILTGTLELRAAGTLPLDRWLAPFATGLTAVVVLLLLVCRFIRKSKPTVNAPDGVEVLPAAQQDRNEIRAAFGVRRIPALLGSNRDVVGGAKRRNTAHSKRCAHSLAVQISGHPMVALRKKFGFWISGLRMVALRKEFGLPTSDFGLRISLRPTSSQ